MTPQDQEKYADKIAKLLRKAESTTPQEAEALVAKAQTLMTQYAISEDLLAKARGDEIVEKIVQETVTYTGVYSRALFDIGSAIAKANGCRVLISNGGKTTDLIIIGFEKDVARSKMLDTSVQIQAVSALTKWWSGQDTAWMSATLKYKTRRDFIFGFASGLRQQLAAAKRAGEQAAAEEEAKRAQVSSAEASESVALVIRDKKARVDEWMDKEYGKLRKSAARYSSGAHGAHGAGHAAGQRADVGTGGRVRGGVAGQLGA